MRRREFLQAAAAAVTSAPAVQTQPGRRNIVFILVDDHRYDFIGAMGHPWLKGHTPNIDRLLNGGVHFKNAFVTSSLCSPSRASLLTGRYMHSHRVTDNFSMLDSALPTFPGVLQRNGYRTAFIGKWHMGGASDEPQPGFHQWVSFRGQGEYQDPELNRNGAREKQKGQYDRHPDRRGMPVYSGQCVPPFLYLPVAQSGPLSIPTAAEAHESI